MRGFISDSLQTNLNGTTHYRYDAVGHLFSAQQGGQELQDYEGDTVGLNVYAYVNGDPILQVDPLGLQGLIPISIPTINVNPIGHGGKLHSLLGDFISFGNGNLFDGFDKQDNRCSVPLVGSILDKNECILDRCKKHDDCYSENECNYSSWGSSLLNGNKACNQCNAGFFK